MATVRVQWQQAEAFGSPIPRWFGAVVEPRRCAWHFEVNAVASSYQLEVKSARIGAKAPATVHGPVRYPSLNQAKRHAERWAHYHWETV